MSERRFDPIAEKTGEDYHPKPRLFWAQWYLAVENEPEQYPAGVRDHVRQQFETLPDSFFDQHPDMRQIFEKMLSAQMADVCRQEAATLQ